MPLLDRLAFLVISLSLAPIIGILLFAGPQKWVVLIPLTALMFVPWNLSHSLKSSSKNAIRIFEKAMNQQEHNHKMNKFLANPLEINSINATRIHLPRALLACILAGVVGCSSNVDIAKMAPAQERDFVIRAIRLLHTQQIDSVANHLSPSLINQSTMSELAKMAEVIPSSDYDSMKFINYRFSKNLASFSKGPAGLSITSFEMQYYYGKKAVFATATVENNLERLYMTHLRLYPLEKSLEKLHEFKVFGSGFTGLFVLLLFGAIFGVVIYSAIDCFRNQDITKKWIWIPFIAVGVVGINYNWSTQDFGIQLFHVKFLGIGFVRPGLVGPWIASFTVPLGAILYLIKKRKMKQTSSCEDEDDHDDFANYISETDSGMKGNLPPVDLELGGTNDSLNLPHATSARSKPESGA